MKRSYFFFVIVIFVVGVIGVAWVLGDKALTRATQKEEIELAKAVYNENVARNAVLSNQDGDLEKFSDVDWPKPITLKDIRITQDNSTTTITTYAYAVLSTIKKLTISSTLALELQQGAYANQDKASLTALKTLALSFAAAQQDIASLVVPSSATTLHLRILTSLTRYSFVLNHMAKIDTEPLLALEAAQSHKDIISEVINDLLFMNAYFVDNNIPLIAKDRVPLYISQ